MQKKNNQNSEFFEKPKSFLNIFLSFLENLCKTRRFLGEQIRALIQKQKQMGFGVGLYVFGVLLLGNFFCLIGAAQAQEQKGRILILYSGLTEEQGWQIFRYDLASRKQEQLTFSLGDKRNALYHTKSNRVYYRDALGRICYAEGKKDIIALDLRNCAHFVFDKSGENVYFTNLLTGNPHRQSLWQAKIIQDSEEFGKPVILQRPQRGAYRQVAISPDESKIVLTEVWRLSEERMLLLNKDLLPKNDILAKDYISQSGKIAVYPAWSPMGDLIYYSVKVSKNNFDLYSYSLKAKKVKKIWESNDASEFAANISPDGKLLAFEQLKDGKRNIVCVDLQSLQRIRLSISHQSKEPFIYLK